MAVLGIAVLLVVRALEAGGPRRPDVADSPGATPAGGTVPVEAVASPPSVGPASFAQLGGRLVVAVPIVNPNLGWWWPSMEVTFTVRGSSGLAIASGQTTLPVAPGASVRAALAGIRVPSGDPVQTVEASVTGGPEPSDTYVGSGLRVVGTGLNSVPGGELVVGAMVANSSNEATSGFVTCLTEDAGGELTGAATLRVLAPPQGHEVFPVTIPDPLPGSVTAACQVLSAGR